MSEKTKVLETVNFFKRNYPEFRPDVLLVLGSGLGSLVRTLNPQISIGFDQVPNFAISTVPGHSGSLNFCQVKKLKLAVMSGRIHAYEGYTPGEVVRPIRVLRLLGTKAVFLTNAAGALNPLFEAGGIMCISDHINLSGQNPLVGQNYEEWGDMFPDMSRVYCPSLRKKALEAALRIGLPLHVGVYVGVKGPSLETPAETRAYRMMGGDAIGMSTALEAIAATQMGMKILGLSCLTNKNLPDCMEEISHEQILEIAGKINDSLTALLLEIINGLDPDALH